MMSQQKGFGHNDGDFVSHAMIRESDFCSTSTLPRC